MANPYQFNKIFRKFPGYWLRLMSHTTKSVTVLSFSSSAPAIPNHNSSHICKSVNILINYCKNFSWKKICWLCSS